VRGSPARHREFTGRSRAAHRVATYSDGVTQIGMGTTSVLPRRLRDAFRLAAEAGFDGIEVMITSDRATQDPSRLAALRDEFGMPVLSIHAPVLLFSSHVFGRNPLVKLRRSVELAEAVGATTVVVHPPYRWQRRSAALFVETVRRLSERHGMRIAVENMFPVTRGGIEHDPFAPSWNPGELDVDALTLDFSHAGMSGRSAADLAREWGSRLQHVHLCDAACTEPGGALLDEHLVPGRGAQPVAEVLQGLAESGFAGHIIAEITTRACGRDDEQRVAWLRETLAFARSHTRVLH
jgi:sugar phosphate isomerase/epimerase